MQQDITQPDNSMIDDMRANMSSLGKAVFDRALDKMLDANPEAEQIANAGNVALEMKRAARAESLNVPTNPAQAAELIAAENREAAIFARTRRINNLRAFNIRNKIENALIVFAKFDDAHEYVGRFCEFLARAMQEAAMIETGCKVTRPIAWHEDLCVNCGLPAEANAKDDGWQCPVCATAMYTDKPMTRRELIEDEWHQSLKGGAA